MQEYNRHIKKIKILQYIRVQNLYLFCDFAQKGIVQTAERAGHSANDSDNNCMYQCCSVLLLPSW